MVGTRNVVLSLVLHVLITLAIALPQQLKGSQHEYVSVKYDPLTGEVGKGGIFATYQTRDVNPGWELAYYNEDWYRAGITADGLTVLTVQGIEHDIKLDGWADAESVRQLPQVEKLGEAQAKYLLALNEMSLRIKMRRIGIGEIAGSTVTLEQDTESVRER